LRFRAFAPVLLTVLVACAWCEGQVTAPKLERSDGIRVLMAALSRGHVSASLVFSGLCNGDFPGVRLPAGLDGQPLEMLQAIFPQNSNLQVSQERDGIIRLSDMETPRDFLNVRISRVRFTMDDATDGPLFDPQEATWAILRSLEVKKFEAAHNIDSRPEAIHLPHAPFTTQSPHISGYIVDVTVSQALDYLLKTFPGLWIYERCPGTVQFSFFTNSPNWELALRDLERRNRMQPPPEK
jgi:hypothetical protein